MPERRALRFESLNDVMPDVDRLLRGHRTAGSWSLGQICRHLSESLRLTVEARPSRKFWWLRWTVGPLLGRHLLRTERMPSGLKIPVAALEPGTDRDARAEAEALRATIRLFLAAEGPFATHPAFGPMTTDQWRRFHCIHCAHHLSFALPEPAGAGPG